MKPKAAKFKNPFDLMEEEQQQIIDLKPQNNAYNPNPYVPKGKVHAPLPFNPFESATTTTSSDNYSVKQTKASQPATNYSTIIKQTKKNAVRNKAGFANPFGSELIEPEEEQITPVQTKNAVMGFNPQHTPQYKSTLPQPQYSGPLNEDGDPPLLQDIGIDLDLIKQRIMMTVKAEKPQYEQLENTDLSGPILIALAFGCLLLLSGKIHFGDIYAMFLFGNSIMYFLVNFMNQADVIPLYNVMSTLGYALLPMLILGGLGIIFTLKGTLGILISLSIAFWSSLAAGNTLEVYLREPHNNRRVLIIYPLFLFYLCFAMIVIF